MNEYIEPALRGIFGIQMLFWGLNGFFHWIQLPPASPAIEKLISACIESRFIMFTVKSIEVIFGACLVLGFMVPLSLLMFAPIMFVITGLHLFHNPRPWLVLISYTVPYTILLLLHGDTLLRIVY